MSRTHARRRGFQLIEMIVTLGLLAVFGTVSAKVLSRLLMTNTEMATGEREATAADRAATNLRHDVERATRVSLSGGTLALGDVTWTTDADGLSRVDVAGARRFGPLPAPAVLGVAGRMVTLRVGEAEWSSVPLVEPAGASQ